VNFEFPVPDACLNPECLMPIPPKKHGFYERNCLDVTYRGRVLDAIIAPSVVGLFPTYLPFAYPITSIPWL
jgi:hypothetical protein